MIIVRSAPDEIKAYHNSCLHRGRQIKEGTGSTTSLGCPYHGWTWNLDGSFNRMLCDWDFPQMTGRDLSLPQVRVDTWDGFVFINFDDDAAPLLEHLDVLPEHFKHFPLNDKFTAINIQKVLPANWKVALEAFLETYHAPYTHPASNEWSGDVNAQYDVWNTSSRLFMPTGVRSPVAGPDDEPELVFEEAVVYFGAALGDDAPTTLPPGVHPRSAIADVVRQVMAKTVGADCSGASDSEVIDAIEYFVFPNWSPWGGVTHGFQYRFRPNGFDPDSCIFDVRLRFPLPASGERPPAAPVRVLTDEETFADLPELMALGPLLDDDYRHMGPVQRGLHASHTGKVSHSDYQESRIRHFHQLLDEALGLTGDYVSGSKGTGV